MLAPSYPLTFPAGYTARPARLDDVEAIVATLNAAEQDLLGEQSQTVAGWTREMQFTGMDPETDTRVIVAPGGAVAAFAALWDKEPHVIPEHLGCVHPQHRGRGLGTDLMRWLDERGARCVAEAPPGVRVALQAWVNQLDHAAHALLRDCGYQLARHNLRMIIDFDGPPPEPEWPAGIAVRTFVPGRDERETRLVIREAFRDHWGHVESPFEEDLERWQKFSQSDPDFDPSLWFLAMADGRIVGTSLCHLRSNEDPNMSWVYSVGVLRPWRRQGVAYALLRHSFAELYRRGQRRAALGVDADSLTGATRLYEKAGMRPDPRHQYQIWEKELRTGRDLSTAAK
jgi:mycothiol synthase